jgi:hypothetical protein
MWYEAIVDVLSLFHFITPITVASKLQSLRKRRRPKGNHKKYAVSRLRKQFPVYKYVFLSIYIILLHVSAYRRP